MAKCQKIGFQEEVKMMVATTLLPNNVKKTNNNNKNCSKTSPKFVDTVATIAAVSSICTDTQHVDTVADFALTRTYTSCIDSPYTTMSKQKCFVSTDKNTSSICTVASDSTSDSSITQQCDDLSSSGLSTFKINSNQPLLPTPSVERLLPIGSQRTSGIIGPLFRSQLGKIFRLVKSSFESPPSVCIIFDEKDTTVFKFSIIYFSC